MIRRNSSKARKRHPLGRSKSMNFVPETAVHDLVTIEPRNAHRDAHIAAALSYERAQMEAAMDEQYYQRLSNDLQQQTSCRRNDSVLGHSTDVCQLKPGPMTFQRQQSVRFAGPSAKQPKQLASSTESHPESVHAGKREGHPRAPPGRKWRSEGSKQLISSERSCQSYSATQSISKPISGVSSTPLTGRRLRKSRSMFVPFQTSAQETSRNSFDRLEEWLMPCNHDVFDQASGRAQIKTLGILRAPKSMSFLRPNMPKASSSSQSSVRNYPIALEPQTLHADMRLRDRSLKSHSSMLFLPKNKRKAGLGGSLRNSSNNTDPVSSTFSITHSALSKSSGFRNVARKASLSLKKKFKGIFKRKQGSEDIQGPSFTLGSDHDSLAQTDISTHEEASISRVRSHIPSLHSVSPVRCPQSRHGSLESVEDDIPQTEGERSRVTSWTNSSTNASQITIGDRERQRLSVINESGNINVQTTGPQLQCTAAALTASTNNQRVYSALIKRLDEMNQQQSREKQQSVQSGPEMREKNMDPPRPSRQDGRHWTPSTIRCVYEDDDVFKDDCTASETPMRVPEPTPEIRGKIPQTPTVCSTFESPSERRSIGRQTPTRSSAFFGSPSNHLFRTQSPYRRALRQNMKSQRETTVPQTSTRYLSYLSTLILPVRMPSPSNSDQNSQCGSVESIYSYHSEALEEKHAAGDSTSEELNSAFPVVWQPADQEELQPVSSSSPTRHREVSTASSVEWKKWLSANVSKLETPPSNHNAACRQSFMRTISSSAGHVREDAEIDSPVAEGSISQSEFIEVTYSEKKETQATAGCQTPLNAIDLNEASGRRRSSVTDENSHPNSLSCKTSIFKDMSPVPPLRIGLRAAASLPNVKNPRQAWGNKTMGVRLANSVSQSGSFTSAGIEVPGNSIYNRRIPATMSMQSSPGLTDSVESQFGKAGGYNDCWDENQDLNAQAIGSRRMVEVLLNSKQQRPDMPQISETMTNAPTAFL